MKLITELVEDVQYLSEEKDGKKSLFIEGIFLQGNIKNRNGRVYPEHVLDKEVKRYTESHIVKNRGFGELGHPEGPSINLDRISHIITELKKDGSNYIGRAKITDTPMGNIAKGIMESGGQLGVSSRGMGSLKEGKNGMEVQGDFFLATPADIVADPSAPDAFVNGIMEGVEFWFTDEGTLKKEVVAEETKREIEKAVVSRELNEEKVLRLFKKYLRSI